MLDIPAYLSFFLIVGIIVVSGQIFFYSEAGIPWHTYLTVFSCLLSSYAILLIVPLDVGVVIQDRRNTDVDNYISNYEDNVNLLRPIYKTFYIILTVLANVVLIFEETYNSDGYFNVKDRFKSSIKRYIFQNGPYLIAGLIILGILIGEKILPSDGDALLFAIIIVSNTLNLFALMFVLGYGLVAYPLMLWQSASSKTALLKAQQQAAAQFKRFNDISVEVSQLVADAKKTKHHLSNQHDSWLLAAMATIEAECPPEFRSEASGQVAIDQKANRITIDSLAELRRKLNIAKDEYRLAQGRLDSIKLNAYTAEDIHAARNRTDGVKEINWSFRQKPGGFFSYYWYTSLKPILLRCFAVMCAMLTVLSFLGIIGSFKGNSEETSTYFLAVEADTTTPSECVFFVFLTFGYMSVVTFWAISQIRVSGTFEMVPFRTTPESLSFNARLVARFAAPMAFFYLGWIFENGTNNGEWVYSDVTIAGQPQYEMLSSFAEFYQIQLVSWLSAALNTVFPGIVCVIVFLVVTNLINRLLVLIKLPQYQFGDEIPTDGQLKDGKTKLERQKKMMERTVKRYSLKNVILGVNRRAKNGSSGNETGDGSPPNQNRTSLLDDSKSLGCWQRFMMALFGVVGATKGGLDDTNDRGSFSFSGRMEIPEKLEGWVERKDEKSLGLTVGWTREYAVVIEPGILKFWKNNDQSVEPLYSADLKLISNMEIPSVVSPTKGTKKSDKNKTQQPVRVDIELSNQTVKLRFLTEEDAKHWMQMLDLWKDYALECDYHDKDNFFEGLGLDGV